MAGPGRIRTVKPEFFLSEELFDLEQTSALPVRVAFAGLFTQADRDGLFRWRPRQLKATIIPYDDADFEDVLRWLCVGGFVGCYEVDGDRFGCVLTFAKHQVVNNKERASELPAPDGETVAVVFKRVKDAWRSRRDRVADAWPTRGPRVTYGTERKGSERNGSERKGTEGNGRELKVDRSTLENNGENLSTASPPIGNALGVCDAIRKRLSPRKPQDEDLIAKVATLVGEGALSERDVMDAAEGAAVVAGVRNRSAYFLKCLYEKVGEGKLKRQLARCNVPPILRKV